MCNMQYVNKPFGLFDLCFSGSVQPLSLFISLEFNVGRRETVPLSERDSDT